MLKNILASLFAFYSLGLSVAFVAFALSPMTERNASAIIAATILWLPIFAAYANSLRKRGGT